MTHMRCWNCGFHNIINEYKYCGNCGAERKILCPQCNHPTLPDLQYCGNCGYDLDKILYFPIEEYKKNFGEPTDNFNFLRESFGGLREDSYIVVVTEKKMNIPFKISPSIINKTAAIIENTRSQAEKARQIFDYITNTIQYGKTKRGSSGYRDAIEVFFQQEGVCGEMAILYVSMARIAGLIANYVSVRKDNSGKEVSHACAVVCLNGKNILVDLSYYAFDINHMDYKVLTDQEFIENFKRWDG